MLILFSAEETPFFSQCINIFSVVKIPAAEDSPAFTVEAIVDPASREAQKLAPILQILQAVANVDVRVYMNSKEQLSDMPVTR